jgi:hypothetical protein
MKTAIFENLEFLLPEGCTGLERILSGGNSIVRGGKQLVGAVAALPVPYLGGALSKAQPLLFSAIRNQIVCVDDLERRGALPVKDVLGLISYLREQRSCKVVLLLKALMTFVESSIFDIEEIITKAHAVEESRKQQNRMAAFEEAWRPFHDGFGNNEDEVCASIIAGIHSNFEVVSRPNLDAAMSILTELGRNEEVEALMDFATIHGGDEFWTSDDPFHRRMSDPRIQRIVEEKRKATGPVFQFEKDLLSTAHSMNGDKLAQLAAFPIERYQDLFENSAGIDLHNYIYAAFEYRKIGNPTDHMKKVISNAEEALRRIARKSKLNEIRVRKYEILVGAAGHDQDEAR